MQTTVVLTTVSFAIALAVGTVVAAWRVGPVPPLRWAGGAYVETVRNTPLTVLMLLAYFGLPKVGLVWSGFTTAVLVLALYTGTFVAETVRSGINAVGAGQVEAARAIGLTFPESLRHVILPQALRTVVAPLGSLLIALTKNSSLASLITVVELTEVADRLNNATARPVPIFLGAATAYVLLTLPMGWAVGWLERRTRVRR